MFPTFAFGFEDKPLYLYFDLINLNNIAILFNNRNYFGNLIFQNVWNTLEKELKSMSGVKCICHNEFKCIKNAGCSVLSQLVSLWCSYILRPWCQVFK